MADRTKKFLLVEGVDDLYAIVELMRPHIGWPKKKADAPVTIIPRDGVENVLDADTIPLRLKSREVEILGIIIDANDNLDGRWQRLSDLCRPAFPSFPKKLPATGLVVTNGDQKKFGVWIMPDNTSRGMMETFMAFLIPDTEINVWGIAKDAVDQARQAGAKFAEAHRDKANISTWLAWQDPPGNSMGTALIRMCLNAHAPFSAPFVNWFRQLYEI